MPEIRIFTIATYAAQALGAAVIAALLFGFRRQYGKSYLAHWTSSWVALTIYHLAGAAGVILGLWMRLPPMHPARLASAATAAVAGYLQIAWLLFGVYELLRRRPVRMRVARQVILALAVMGVLSALIFLDGSWPPAYRHFTRVGIRSLLAAAAFFVASVAFWKARKRREGIIGFTMISAAFFAFALQQTHYLVIAVASLFGYEAGYLVYLGYVDFLLQFMTGVGMIACLLEDEREASELATVEIEHLAYHDALTGLPNRPLFMDRLIVAVAQASRANQKMAVFFLDLDRFKDINDSLGHSTGDALLKVVAERIRRCVREGDTVARFGGDEFTLLIPRIENIEDAAKIAQKIIDNLKIPFLIAEREMFVTTSIGIGIFPSDGHDPETLVRNADTAMYRAKDQGRDNYQLYAPAMNARALERLALENMLRKALSQRELMVYYQPLIDLASKRIVGLEALVRWQHPDLGLLLPAHFISTAELSGLIIPIGQWVMLTAAKQLRQWQKRVDSNLTVSVNLSARQFQQPNLVSAVADVLDESGIHPRSLELEITESNAMQNAEVTIHTLRELKALGVRISMDDFGTGYSSLNYLKRFPIDTLKLDQSFVREINTDRRDAAIVSAVISMAHSLDLKVVAEGVETEEQLAFLHQQRCDRIQGFLFSAPMSAEELEPYLMSRRALSVG
jgi:diguanylate cyclase (GGDEF)-like protein